MGDEPGQTLQHFSGTTICSERGHERGGQILSGSCLLHFMDPWMHSQSVHSGMGMFIPAD